MIKFNCLSCGHEIEIDENDYEPGSVISIRCPKCKERTPVEIPKPEVEEEPELPAKEQEVSAPPSSANPKPQKKTKPPKPPKPPKSPQGNNAIPPQTPPQPKSGKTTGERVRKLFIFVAIAVGIYFWLTYDDNESSQPSTDISEVVEEWPSDTASAPTLAPVFSYNYPDTLCLIGNFAGAQEEMAIIFTQRKVIRRVNDPTASDYGKIIPLYLANYFPETDLIQFFSRSSNSEKPIKYVGHLRDGVLYGDVKVFDEAIPFRFVTTERNESLVESLTNTDFSRYPELSVY